jgi:hypothetical protein
MKTTWWRCPCGTEVDNGKPCGRCGIAKGTALYYMAKTERNTRTTKNILIFWMVLSIVAAVLYMMVSSGASSAHSVRYPGDGLGPY